ncbi:MAG: hypothetical protein CM15mP46_2410 [Alphaproteobacteria bacterium]|nr:MAG: hypothetical protein CM15mP46_2410 [Alphaproteobacteria bacterium]
MSAQAHADHGAPLSFVRRWLYSKSQHRYMYLVLPSLPPLLVGACQTICGWN